MVYVEAHNTFDFTEWRNLILKLNGNAFHLPEILLIDSDPDSLVFLVFREGSNVIAASVGVSLKQSFLKLLTKSKTLHLPTLPASLSDGDAKQKEIYDSLLRHAQESGYKALEIEPRWGDDFRDIPVFNDFIDSSLIEFTVDLEKHVDDIFKSMHKKHKKNIRKALECGLKIEHDESLDAFLELRKMQQASSERASEKDNRYSIQDKKFYIEAYKKVYQTGIGKVLFAKKGGERIAALAYLAFGKKAVTVRSGSTAKGYETSAMYLLQYELIKLLKAQGFCELNIGGVPAKSADPAHPQHGLYNYKRYYGGTPCLRTGIRIKI